MRTLRSFRARGSWLSISLSLSVSVSKSLSPAAWAEEERPRTDIGPFFYFVTKPITTADAIVSPEEEADLLKRVVWPSHEPLAFLRRRGGLKRGYEAEYERYHTPENAAIVARLLGPGGMYTTHFYKGMGLTHEAEEMERGLALAAEMRRRGRGLGRSRGRSRRSMAGCP